MARRKQKTTVAEVDDMDSVEFQRLRNELERRLNSLHAKMVRKGLRCLDCNPRGNFGAEHAHNIHWHRDWREGVDPVNLFLPIDHRPCRGGDDQ